MAGIDDIAFERKRQIEIEGYDAGHDDEHSMADLAKAAAAYAVSAFNSAIGVTLWPWHVSEFQPDGARRNLVKAGALIVAAIDWLDRRSTMVCHTCNDANSCGDYEGPTCEACNGEGRIRTASPV